MNTGMSWAATVEPGVLRRYASDQIVTLAKLVSAEIALIKSAAKESEDGLVFHLLGEAN